MVIVELTGGLGNQLFQYAAARALAFFHRTQLKLDISSFLREELPDLEVPRNFELQQFVGVEELTILNYINDNSGAYKFLRNSFHQKFLPRHKRPVYKEPFYHYDKNFFLSNKDVLLKGGWQSEKYFEPFKHEIKEILNIKTEATTAVKLFGEEMKAKNSVSVHVRRGDYLRKQIILEWHGILGIDYYKSAFDMLEQEVNPIHIYYFSDDPEWVKHELLPLFPGTIVAEKINSSAIEDFYLMSCCRHNIIANSSFSWWAAYLNSNPNKIVIAPKKWFGNAPNNTKDLYPKEWLLI